MGATRRSSLRRFTLGGALAPLGIIALAGLASSEPGSNSLNLTVRMGASGIFIQAEAVPLRSLLEAVTQRTGVDFVIAPGLEDRRVTISIAGLALERAIETIVGTLDSAAGTAATYEQVGVKTQLRLIRIVDRGSPAKGSLESVGGSSGQGAEQLPDATRKKLERHLDKLGGGAERELLDHLL